MANEIFRVGKVSSIDYAAGLVRVVYPDKDNSVTAPLPMLCTEYNMPQVGDPVMVLHQRDRGGAGPGPVLVRQSQTPGGRGGPVPQGPGPDAGGGRDPV